MNDDRKVTIPQAEYDELKALLLRSNNSYWRLHVVPTLWIFWNSRIAWFLAGVLLTAGVISPFVSGGAEWLWKNPSITVSTLSPSQIAQAAPNNTTSDTTKRKILIQVCQTTADHLRQGTLTSKSNAMSELRMGTINLQSGEWKPTHAALDAYLSVANELDDLADRLDEIVKAFSNSN